MKKSIKTHSYKQYRNEDDNYEERKPRHKVKAIQQNKDAKRIERALKRKDYMMLSEDLY